MTIYVNRTPVAFFILYRLFAESRKNMKKAQFQNV